MNILLLLLALQVPGRVTTLTAAPLSDTSAVLTWTEVNSGTTAIARYDVRFARADSLVWSQAKDVLVGGCAAPVYGSTAGGGRTRSCVLGGLQQNVTYDIAMVAYRGTLNSNAVFGPISNVARVMAATRIGSLMISGQPTREDSVFTDGIAVSSYPGWPGHKGRYPIHGSFYTGVYSLGAYVGDTLVARGYLVVVKP